jgi:hypothetical protein
MKTSASPGPGATLPIPFMAAASRALVVVVPTAMTRRPSSIAALMDAAAAGEIS